MAPTPGGIPPVKEKGRQENRFTVMIMRGVGGVHSFKISPRLLYLTSVFFLVFVVVSILVINNYLSLRRINAHQSQIIRGLGEENVKGKKKLDRSKEHILLLENYVLNLEERSKLEESPPAPQENAEKAVPAEMEEKGARPETEIRAEVVDIRDIVIQKEGTRMTVNFKLVNLNPGENAVGGYVHIIARNMRSRPPLEWSYPDEELKKGVPTNYRRGKPFLIQRFKPMNAKFMAGTISEMPSAIRVLVYDQSGVLVLEKEFEVNDIS
jgi:hypothetical protein